MNVLVIEGTDTVQGGVAADGRHDPRNPASRTRPPDSALDRYFSVITYRPSQSGGGGSNL